MLKKIVIIKNPLEPLDFETFEVENTCEFLKEYFGVWPKGATIYTKSICYENEFRLETEKDIEELSKLECDIFIVIYAQGPLAVAIFALIFAVAISLALKQSIPNIAQRNQSQTSPNNELSSRSNSARTNGRIPDIFGTVRSVPDLISLPYSTFINNLEIEHSTMCIGRGQYEILDSRDGDTPISQINGASVQVYLPFEDIDSGTPYYSVGDTITETPANVKRSNSVNGQTLNASNAVGWIGNNNVYFTSDGEIIKTGGASFLDTFEVGDSITIVNAHKYFDGTGGLVSITPHTSDSFVFATPYTEVPPEWANGGSFTIYPDSGGDNEPIFVSHDFGEPEINIAGVYIFDRAEINEVSIWRSIYDGEFDVPTLITYSALQIFLSNSVSVNGNWSLVVPEEYLENEIEFGANFLAFEFNLDGVYTIGSVTEDTITVTETTAQWANIPGGESSTLSATISLTSDTQVGPFILNNPNSELLQINFVAPNGIYKDNGTVQTASSVDIEVLTTPVNSSGIVIGDTTSTIITMTGSDIERGQVGQTLTLFMPGRLSIVARRITLKDSEFEGQISDEIKWRDLYQSEQFPTTILGNVTIVRSRTIATTGALSVKDRKLNLLVTRQIPLRISGEDFSTELQSTNKASEIIAEICKDPKIGGRPNSEIDFENIYSTISSIEEYFGIAEAAEFSYTFDKNGMTFEETITSVASAIFCTAYRRGSLIKLDFEKATEDSTILFNHRNKIPNSESRTVRFGSEKNYDGIEYTWVDPIDDSINTLQIPDSEINKPKKIESVGVRNYKQAFLQANREWNKIRYQNTVVEFDAIAQGELILNGDRILVADNTRQDEQDGEITSHVGFIVGTSQPVVFESGETYTVFLQMYNGTVQSIVATEVSGNPNAMTLAEAPLLALVVDDNSFVKTTYLLIKDSDTRKRAFLVTERTNSEANTFKITAVNYDSRYYQEDATYL